MPSRYTTLARSPTSARAANASVDSPAMETDIEILLARPMVRVALSKILHRQFMYLLTFRFLVLVVFSTLWSLSPFLFGIVPCHLFVVYYESN